MKYRVGAFGGDSTFLSRSGSASRQNKSVSVVLKTSQAMHFATKVLSVLLRVTGVLMLITALFFMSYIAFFWLVHLEMEASNVAGPAPKGDYSIRRKWGEQNLGVYLASAESWIKRNKEIENDIGKVQSVAPIFGPNKHGSSFGESGTTLNLQVIGTQGEGWLKVEEYNWDGRSGKADWQEKHWNYQRAAGRLHKIARDVGGVDGTGANAEWHLLQARISIREQFNDEPEGDRVSPPNTNRRRLPANR